MAGRRRYLRRVLTAAMTVGLVLLLGGCSVIGGTPQSANNPVADNARKIWNLFVPIFWLSVIVFVIVQGILIVAVIKFRRKPGQPLPRPIHGNTKLEIAWTLVPALILAAIAVPTISGIVDLAKAPGPGAVTIRVIGQQWWWAFQYPDQHFVTADELHVPVNTPVHLELESRDIIHSFWAPRLFGKQDVVPGRTNAITFTPNKVGVYDGQCAEFCGQQHANMRFRLIVDSKANYDAWIAKQQSPPATPTAGTDAAKGRDLVLGLHGQTALPCFGCHTINGEKTGAGAPMDGSGPPDAMKPPRDIGASVSNGALTGPNATAGPNLTHFGSRLGIAGDVLTNNQANLEKWIHDTQLIKPGNDMPAFTTLTPDQLREVAAYLESLK